MQKSKGILCSDDNFRLACKHSLYIILQYTVCFANCTARHFLQGLIPKFYQSFLKNFVTQVIFNRKVSLHVYFKQRRRKNQDIHKENTKISITSFSQRVVQRSKDEFKSYDKTHQLINHTMFDRSASHKNIYKKLFREYKN